MVPKHVRGRDSQQGYRLRILSRERVVEFVCMQDSSLCETVDVSPRGGVWRRAVQTPSAEVALDDVLTQTKQKKIEKEKQNNRDAVTSSHQSSSRPRSSFSSVTLYREPVRVQTRQPTRARRSMTSTLGSLYRMTKQLKLNSKEKTRRFSPSRRAGGSNVSRRVRTRRVYLPAVRARATRRGDPRLPTRLESFKGVGAD